MAIGRSQSVGVGKKVRRKRKPAVGPQGLPIQNTSAQADRSPAPAPKPKPIVQSVAQSPPVRKINAKRIKAEQKRMKYSGDYPTEEGRTNVPDARQSPEYRQAVKYLLGKERSRLGYTDDRFHPSKIVASVPTSDLEDELNVLRATQRKGSSYTVAGKKVDPDAIFETIARNTSGQTGPGKIEAALEAPVLKVLEQTTRPLHAIAGATDAAVQGKNVLKAASRGIQNKDKTTFSDVLKHVGAPGAVASVGGFALDVAADPTTYLTGGTGSVARKAAEKSSKRVTSKALAAGLSREQAERMGQRAAAKVEREATDDAHGLSIRIGGLEIPGIRKATSKVIPRKLKRRAAESKAGRAARSGVADVNPDLAPLGLSKEESRQATRATRTARAKGHRGAYEAQQRAIAIKRQIGDDNYQRVIDAIEADDLGRLPDNLRDAAIEVRSLFRHAERLRRQAGIRSAGEVTPRRIEDVPEVTAQPAEQLQRDVARARRAVTAAEKRLTEALQAKGVAQGRAEILSRQVAGARGERTAEDIARARTRLERAEAEVRTGRPEDVLRFIDEAERATGYPGGGHGVNVATAAHDMAREALQTAKAHLAEAEAAQVANTQLARRQRKLRRDILKANKKASASAKGYIPHIPVRDETAEAGARAGKAGAKTVKASSSMARRDPRPLSEIRKDSPGVFSEDLPQLLADRMSEAASTTAKAELNRELAEAGRKVPQDGTELVLAADEGVFQIKGSDIREITDPDDLAKVTESPRVSKSSKRPKIRPSWQARQGGRFVVLNRKMVEHALEGASPQLRGPGIVKGLDKAQGAFKMVATVPNISFHVRNLVGDTHNAYLAENPASLARNLGQAARALKHLGSREEALRDLGKRVDPSDAGLKIGDQVVPYAELVVMAEQTGAIRSGFIATEIPELMQKQVTKKHDRLHRVSRQLQNREDVVRLATFIGGLKRGLSPAEAAERSSRYHFDYGHLTRFERDFARRAMPFYTFTARNVPLQARTLISRPGKYANYQKVREEAAAASGVEDQPQEVTDLYDKLEQAGVDLPDGWARYVTEWEQRQAGIPVKLGDKTYTISAGLPLTDLGLLPGAGGLDDWAERAVSLATPLIKTPAELFSGWNLTFREPIESDTSPLVPAPAYVGTFPDAAKKKLGITRGTNKRTGEEVWMWPGRVDYLSHVAPGPTSTATRVAADQNRGGLGAEIATLAGVRTTEVDPLSAAMGLAYDRMSEIQKQQAKMRQQGINAENATDEYTRLTDQFHLLEEIIYGAKDLRGDEVLPDTGGPSKVRRRTSPQVSTGWDSVAKSSSAGGWDSSTSSGGW